VRALDQPTVEERVVSRLNLVLDDVVEASLDGLTRVALLDYPLHKNAGDSAIWIGERAWFRRHGVDIVHISTRSTYSARRIRRLLGRNGALALHGGGNFGDVWPRFHALREQVAEDFVDHKVVQLPQTIHFAEESNRRRASAGPLGRHRDLTILCRDSQSLVTIQQTFPGAVARMSPDMAFAIGSQRRAAPSVDVLWLARTDHEQVGPRPLGDANVRVTDWQLGAREARLWRLGATVPRHSHRVASLGRLHDTVSSAVQPLLDPLAALNVRGACDTLSEGKVVVTDRLHAHILCILLGIPHVVLDNDYGKLSTFMAAWTESAATIAPDAERARKIAHALLQEAPGG
jgi:exopolysaccharide biosynthesis predicted pyruvyltransferase EpsI